MGREKRLETSDESQNDATQRGREAGHLTRLITWRSVVRVHPSPFTVFVSINEREVEVIGKKVLVRTYSAGVHFGTLVSLSGLQCVLSGARRIWRWKGANTLHEMSLKGVDTGYSRVSEPVPEIALSEAIEVIPVTEVADSNLSVSRWPQ